MGLHHKRLVRKDRTSRPPARRFRNSRPRRGRGGSCNQPELFGGIGRIHHRNSAGKPPGFSPGGSLRVVPSTSCPREIDNRRDRPGLQVWCDPGLGHAIARSAGRRSRLSRVLARSRQPPKKPGTRSPKATGRSAIRSSNSSPPLLVHVTTRVVTLGFRVRNVRIRPIACMHPPSGCPGVRAAEGLEERDQPVEDAAIHAEEWARLIVPRVRDEPRWGEASPTSI